MSKSTVDGDQPDDQPDLTFPTQLVVDLRRGVIVPVVDPPNVSDDVARVLNARNIGAFLGTCPECGATVTMPNRAERRAARKAGVTVVHVRMEHDDDCPALDPSVPMVDPARLGL